MTEPSSNSDIRHFRVSSEHKYTYTNVGLISYLTVKRQKSIYSIHLIINGIGIPPTRVSESDYEWGFYEIRQHFRNTIPMTSEEEEQRRLETTFVYGGLQAIGYYSGLTDDDLESTIFTKDLGIYFNIESKSPVKYLEVSEVYRISDVHKRS